MKIGVAQTRPVAGDMAANIARHVTLVDLAAANGADMVIFQELSLTGYEPSLARELAIDPDDRRLDVFRRMADTKRMTIGAGAPTRSAAGACISMIIFQPGQPRHAYSKQHLHPDEEPFFVPGAKSEGMLGREPGIALAICYEISVPGHAERARRNGAKIYIASVAKFRSGIEKALERLSKIADMHSMAVLMANGVGMSDGMECAGRTSAWKDSGLLAGQLNDTEEGVIIFDTDTQEVVGRIP